jgi:hypothetical protein
LRPVYATSTAGNRFIRSCQRICLAPNELGALALGRDLVIYGAPIGELSVENVEGDEVAREIVRVAGLTISEEV